MDAGGMEGIAVQPFDMVKTRHQLNSSANEGVYRTLRSIYKEGGFPRFYRGVGAELVGIVPKSSGMYATYEIVRRKLLDVPGYGDTSLSAAIAGFVSGIAEVRLGRSDLLCTITDILSHQILLFVMVCWMRY
jgi:solute carrier family 25 (mitochondrial 2-oxodicarboxylate transporter), member 21